MGTVTPMMTHANKRFGIFEFKSDYRDVPEKSQPTEEWLRGRDWRQSVQ